MKTKIKLSNEFKSDTVIYFIILCSIVFIGCVWYSLTHFLIETLHFPIPSNVKEKDTEMVINTFGTFYIIFIGLAIGLYFVILKTFKAILNYIFIIEKDK